MLQANSGADTGGRPPNNQETALLALGANLTSSVGTPKDTLKAAISELATRGLVIRRVSSLYRTPAFPAGAGPDYVNAAVEVEFFGDAQELLKLLHEVEADFGRARRRRWGQRTLDIDLLAIGDRILPDPVTHRAWRELPLSEQVARTPAELILPHPRLQDRVFVLVPLAEIAADWVHPVLAKSVRDLLTAMSEADVEAVERLE
ncbi:Bifunctional folate synthesis protein [Sulfitobacter sp. THAF37]|uniref:2-amino-4-hydroxy-6- hydroxymethyldihydropteridine diphosphokinase n=1 Tax=Sulfitobacter sp. THAF37 TaxID=2587855 RepID=UPI001269785A|nr:2-amino-4-hydroxy-6-hydroxymethyldihydropteridine diphosphokinase [Sulfitobacter sp. THAF37]QFT57830.1 Bifunctional folate synthesis protein [Sulfitobacter sp. THAF37]